MDDNDKKWTDITVLSGWVSAVFSTFPCFIAIVPISELLCLMRYESVLNAYIHFFVPRGAAGCNCAIVNCLCACSHNNKKAFENILYYIIAI